MEFSRIETLAGVKRTVYNQYDSLVRPLQSWLATQNVHMPYITSMFMPRLRTESTNPDSPQLPQPRFHQSVR